MDSSKREKILEVGKSWIGVKYRFGGSSRETGIDCSHFVHRVYCEAGLNYPYRTTRSFRVGNHPRLKKIERNQAKLGDIMIFHSKSFSLSKCGHAGLYIDENSFLGSQSKGVAFAKYSDLSVNPLTNLYWGKERAVCGYYRYILE